MMQGLKKGLVIRSTGSWYNVMDEKKEVFLARLRGKFKLKGLKVTNPLAVGDEVMFEDEEGCPGQVIIKEILPKKNYIARKSPQNEHKGHIIASNIDQAAIIMTLMQPKTSLGFVDRFLISAEAYRIPGVVIINKIDLLNRVGKEIIEEVFSLYEPLGYRCLAVSAETGENMSELDELLKGKKTLVAGHSGVGKSTLINKISPDVRQKIQNVSETTGKGLHTTTFAEMFEIAPNTFLIDTPGIRELGIMDVGKAELGHYFPEMRALLGACRFHNCTHTNEPGCAVKQAVEEGKISDTRYATYNSIFFNEERQHYH